jgi:hypothetical protein
VLLAQETIDWTKHLKININQPLVWVFKKKVYDKVSWGILFETMLKMGMAKKKFVEMVKLF